MKKICLNDSKNTMGGARYTCKWCGFTSTSYWRTYSNAFSCVNRRFGKSIYKVVSSIFKR